MLTSDLRLYLLCQHNSQMLMLAYYAQNYASIIYKTVSR